jgi:hypothetical protein
MPATIPDRIPTITNVLYGNMRNAAGSQLTAIVRIDRRGSTF